MKFNAYRGTDNVLKEFPIEKLMSKGDNLNCYEITKICYTITVYLNHLFVELLIQVSYLLIIFYVL